MKKLSWVVGMVLVAVVAFGQVVPVPSVNVVGYAKVPQLPGLDLKSAIFYVMSGTNTLQELLGTNGVAGSGEQSADDVYLFVPGTGYKTFFLLSHANPALNRKWIDADSFQLATDEIMPGTGFWLRNRSTTTNYYSFLGEAVLDTEVSINVQPGLQILAYPYSADVDISALSLTNGLAGAGEASADNINVYVPETAGWKTFFLLSHANPALNRKWIDAETFDVAALKLKAGQGFWYKSRGGSTFQWVEKRPYLNN